MTLPPDRFNDSQSETPESEDTDEHSYIHHEKADLNSAREMDVFSFHLGQLIDVLDSVDRWSEAEVLKIDIPNNRIFVSFLYWQSKWDVWVDNILERTATLHTHTYHPSGPLRLRQRVSVQDSQGKWLEAFVVDEQPDEVTIHYRNFAPSFDEKIPRAHTHRFRQYGPDKKLKTKAKQWRVPSLREESREDEVDMLIAHKQAQSQLEPQFEDRDYDMFSRPGSASGSGERKGHGLGNKKSGTSRQSKQSQGAKDIIEENQERQRQITEFSERYLHYIQALEEQNLEVHPVEGDGNCMFRAVAHQVYGDEGLHSLVREKCMDYMQSQADFYCQFVVGGMHMFPLYVAAKRQSGCWGDDPEIQALCEMYGRPAYIWAYDAQRGAKNLRTFHEAAHVHNRGGSEGGSSSGGGVIRLSYYGGGHYDSIHKFGTFDHNNQEKSSNNRNEGNTSESGGGNNNNMFIRSRPGVLEESAIQRVTQSQIQHQNQSQSHRQSQRQSPGQDLKTSGGDGGGNSVLAQELAQVAEAKRVSEQEASDMDLDLAIRASRHDITYWAEQDIESCLLDSIAMSVAEEKSNTSTKATSSRPSSSSSKASPHKQNSSSSHTHNESNSDSDPQKNIISPRSRSRPEGPKRQKVDDDSQWDSSASHTSPRSESKTSSKAYQEERESITMTSVKTLEEQEREVMAESLRAHEEAQLRAAREASMATSGVSGGGRGVDESESEQALLDQALKASLEESFQQQYEGQQYADMQFEASLSHLTGEEDEDDDLALQKALALSSQPQGQGLTIGDVCYNSAGSSSRGMEEDSGKAEGEGGHQQQQHEEDEDEIDPELALALQFSMQER